jgi:hypothetical protein
MHRSFVGNAMSYHSGSVSQQCIWPPGDALTLERKPQARPGGVDAPILFRGTSGLGMRPTGVFGVESTGVMCHGVDGAIPTAPPDWPRDTRQQYMSFTRYAGTLRAWRARVLLGYERCAREESV